MNNLKEYLVSLSCDCREDLPMLDRATKVKFASVQTKIETALIKEMIRKAYAVGLVIGEYNILEEISGTIAVSAYLRIECTERAVDILQRYYPLSFHSIQGDQVGLTDLKIAA